MEKNTTLENFGTPLMIQTYVKWESQNRKRNNQKDYLKKQ